MKLVIAFILGIALQLVYPLTGYTVIGVTISAYKSVFPAKPKYKIGECFSMYGFKPDRILEIWPEDYVVVNADCKETKYYECALSNAIPFKTLENNGKKVDCNDKGRYDH